MIIDDPNLESSLIVHIGEILVLIFVKYCHYKCILNVLFSDGDHLDQDLDLEMIKLSSKFLDTHLFK